MRRGQYLESQIEKVFSYLNSIGVHAHKNHPKRTVDGTYIEGEPFDYEVLCCPPHCFDAKEAEGGAWALSNAKPHQIKNLLNCAAHGVEAYFLVLFERKTLRRFDAEFVRAAIAGGRKSLNINEGRDWNWEELAN